MFYAFEVWKTLDQPKRLVRYHVIAGYPSAEAIIEILEENKIAQEFTVSDLQKFFKSNKLTTNDGDMEITITPTVLKDPKTGKTKTAPSRYHGFDNKEVGVYDG